MLDQAVEPRDVLGTHAILGVRHQFAQDRTGIHDRQRVSPVQGIHGIVEASDAVAQGMAAGRIQRLRQGRRRRRFKQQDRPDTLRGEHLGGVPPVAPPHGGHHGRPLRMQVRDDLCLRFSQVAAVRRTEDLEVEHRAGRADAIHVRPPAAVEAAGRTTAHVILADHPIQECVLIQDRGLRGKDGPIRMGIVPERLEAKLHGIPPLSWQRKPARAAAEPVACFQPSMPVAARRICCSRANAALCSVVLAAHCCRAWQGNSPHWLQDSRCLPSAQQVAMRQSPHQRTVLSPRQPWHRNQSAWASGCPDFRQACASCSAACGSCAAL